MPKKKGQKKISSHDFTLNDCANATKPVHRVKKSTSTEATEIEIPWDQIDNDDLNISEEIGTDGTKQFVFKKKRNHSEPEDIFDDKPGIVYPEIVWYWISKFILPEGIACFARINKATYTITKRESFWRLIYKKYCQNHPRLPYRLHIENGYRAYGLRQRVIRGLYHTHDAFRHKVSQERLDNNCRPYQLVKKRCINMWFYKSASCWLVFLKFKKLGTWEKVVPINFLEELGKIDANPEEDTQVLQVTCRYFNELPPLMGMTLSSLSMVLDQGLRHHRLHLGFNTSSHVSKSVLPECTVILDTVTSVHVFDWWHPEYPHFENKLRFNDKDEESLPMLKNNFFTD